MDRRRFLAGTAAATLSTTIGKSIPAEGHNEIPRDYVQRHTGKLPNILFLMSDQHKRSCMGVAGDTAAVTPNLDALAAQSVRFSNAYCNNPICAPSRASMITGLYSHHVETQNNKTPFLPKHRTMAHHFNSAGYMTALIGKMHFVDAQIHGFEYKLDFNDWIQYLGPKTQIFADELTGSKGNSGAGLPQIDDLWREEGNPWEGHRTHDNRQCPAGVGCISLLAEEDHFESFVARESVRFLRNFGTTGQPFFLISSFLKPHDPFMPAQRFADMFKAEDMRLPRSYGKADKSKLPRLVVKSINAFASTSALRDPVAARRHMAYYYANLAQMDDCLGQIVSALKDLNLENDTIICYTSDHGDMLGDLGLWQKLQFYEGSCGVPLMFRVPGRQAGVCDTPVSLVSLSATLAELAGVEQVAPNDGVSLAPLMDSPHSEKNFGPVFAEFGLTGPQKSMIRSGQWKYTYWLHDLPELYDLKSDPEELNNLAADPQHAAIANELRAQLLDWHRPR